MILEKLYEANTRHSRGTKSEEALLFCCRFIWLQPPPPQLLGLPCLCNLGGRGWSQNKTTAEKAWASSKIFLLRTACSRPQLSSAKLLLYIITLLHKESFYLGQETGVRMVFFCFGWVFDTVSFYQFRNGRELFFILHAKKYVPVTYFCKAFPFYSATLQN